jgi:hypothetical protein
MRHPVVSDQSNRGACRAGARQEKARNLARYAHTEQENGEQQNGVCGEIRPIGHRSKGSEQNHHLTNEDNGQNDNDDVANGVADFKTKKLFRFITFVISHLSESSPWWTVRMPGS